MRCTHVSEIQRTKAAFQRLSSLLFPSFRSCPCSPTPVSPECRSAVVSCADHATPAWFECCVLIQVQPVGLSGFRFLRLSHRTHRASFAQILHGIHRSSFMLFRAHLSAATQVSPSRSHKNSSVKLSFLQISAKYV